MKRLRISKGSCRFFQCGEYGENLQRPHHHALLFGVSFPDRVRLSGSGGDTLYQSAELDELWGHGMCTIGSVTSESAGYVARYALKKISGPGVPLHYQGRVPEFLTMSRRPGIGARWLEEYQGDVYPSDEVIVNGQRTKPPRYYDNAFEKLNPDSMSRLRRRRKAAGKNNPDGTGSRLLVRETVKIAATASLTRNLERHR